jgi:cytochrome bd-type quinol oxidase subunit 2
MNLKNFRPVFELAGLSAVAFACHALWFHFFASERVQHFEYSLAQLYGFFFVCALLIIIVLVMVEQKNLDSVGNTFMLLTCIQIAGAYLLLRPILAAHHSDSSLEKTNFFIVFALFLTIETYVAIRILSKSK